MSQQEIYPPSFFECPYQHHCPHLDRMSVHHAKLIVDQAPHERSQYEQQIQAYRQELQEAYQQLNQLKRDYTQLQAHWQMLHRRQFKANKSQDPVPSQSVEQLSFQAPKSGAPKGHPGWHRSQPSTVDRHVEVAAPCRCPHCGHPGIQALETRWEHLQEDIVLQVRPQVTCFDHQQAWCPQCQKEVVATAADEILNAPIGPVTKSAAIYMRYSLGLPYRKIQKLFEALFGMKFVPATALGFDRMAASKGQPLYEDLRQKIQASSVVYTDETGWRVDGINHFLWYAGNDDLAYYQIHRHRSTEVAQHILGKRFAGVLICDSYAAYHGVVPKARQACLAHYCRDCREILQQVDLMKSSSQAEDSHSRAFAQDSLSIFQEACHLAGQFRETPTRRNIRLSHKKQLFHRLQNVCRQPLALPAAETFRKRLLKEKRDCFTFLEHCGVHPTNNHAERSLRPSVISRKITFGNRSQSGAGNHSVLMSLIQTALRQTIDPIAFLQCLILQKTATAQAKLYNNSS